LKPVYKYILLLLLLVILIVGTGFILTLTGILDFLFSDIITLTSFFTVITAIILIIFFKGQSKGAESQTMHTLFSMSLKFILELVLALVWFFIAKKTIWASLIIFFVLYLTFTLFSIFIILKTLKNRSL
jgi:hypothetical protein